MTAQTGAYHHGDLRAALLAEAAAMIEEGGAASVTMRAIGQRIGVSQAGASRPSGERLRSLGEEYVRFALENPAHYRLMYGREALTREDLPELREAAEGLFEQFVGVIRAHQRSGTIKRQNPRAQAYVAWSAVHGLASLVIEGQIRGTDDIDGLIRQTTRTVLDGMRVRRKVGPLSD